MNWLYREEPDRNEDSGWRLFIGTETEEYLNEAGNARIINIYWLLDRDPTLLTPLRCGYGSAFERKNKESQWHEVKD